jgi:hypothetical protein
VLSVRYFADHLPTVCKRPGVIGENLVRLGLDPLSVDHREVIVRHAGGLDPIPASRLIYVE